MFSKNKIQKASSKKTSENEISKMTFEGSFSGGCGISRGLFHFCETIFGNIVKQLILADQNLRVKPFLVCVLRDTKIQTTFSPFSPTKLRDHLRCITFPTLKIGLVTQKSFRFFEWGHAR